MEEQNQNSAIVMQAKLYDALSKAQLDFPEIAKTSEVTVKMKSGGSYNFKYAELPDIIKATRPALSKNGLAVTSTFQDDKDGLSLCTALVHKDGGRLVSVIRIPPTPGPQELGSLVTYMRRYQYSLIVGVAPEDDIDANNVSTTKTESFSRPEQQQKPAANTPPSPRQLEYIKSISNDLNIQIPQVRTSIEATQVIDRLMKQKAAGGRIG